MPRTLPQDMSYSLTPAFVSPNRRRVSGNAFLLHSCHDLRVSGKTCLTKIWLSHRADDLGDDMPILPEHGVLSFHPPLALRLLTICLNEPEIKAMTMKLTARQCIATVTITAM